MTAKNKKFVKLRNAHSHEKAEDYVEMIQDLVDEKGEARVSELAKRFGVTAVTVHKIIARLQREDLVSMEPYRSLFLTPRGKKLASQCRSRHEAVYQFLRRLGISEDVAHIDAEGMEHHVSSETLSIFKNFVSSKK